MKNNIHLSKTELSIIIDIVMDAINNYEDSKSRVGIYNNTYINLLCKSLAKMNQEYQRLNGGFELDWKYISGKWKNYLKEISRDKILELNNRHVVKTKFHDLADFNRWEKVRTFTKA